MSHLLILWAIDLTLFFLIFSIYFIFGFHFYFSLFWDLGKRYNVIQHSLFFYYHPMWLVLIGNSSILLVHYIISPLQASKVWNWNIQVARSYCSSTIWTIKPMQESRKIWLWTGVVISHPLSCLHHVSL